MDGHYLARPAPGYGEAAAGDHLQLRWSFWLLGHQVEQLGTPWTDPYSFQPEATAAPNVQGWLLGLPYWPLERLFGGIWAYNLVVLLSVVAAGGLTCWWLRALGLTRGAALAGGLVYALAPYRVGQSTGHLLGLVSFLLPALLLALERRRLGWAVAALVAIPLSGQLHLVLGAIPLFLGYAWARLPRALWGRAALGAGLSAAAAVGVYATIVRGSIASGGRSLASVERYSAELSDFFARRVGAGTEELVFLGWLVPVLALVGLAAAWRRQRGLAWLLGISALLPTLLALGTNLPLYEPLWRALPPLRFARVPERLLPIACLAVAALVALALELVFQKHKRLAQRSSRSCSSCSHSTCGCRSSGRSRQSRAAERTRQCTVAADCSSSRCSVRTSTSAPPIWHTRPVVPESARRATRRLRPPTQTGLHDRSAASPAGAASCPLRWT